MSPASQAYVGYGSRLMYSLDGVNYTPVAQLQRIQPSGSKQAMVDQTNLRTADNFTRVLAAVVDAGEIEFTGVYSGVNSQVALGLFHGEMTLVHWRILLSDGTMYGFDAYLSQFKPWGIVYNKMVPFSGTLRINGGIESPLSGFQPNGFQASGFQIVLI